MKGYLPDDACRGQTGVSRPGGAPHGRRTAGAIRRGRLVEADRRPRTPGCRSLRWCSPP